MSSSSSSSDDEIVIIIKRKQYRDRVNHLIKWEDKDFLNRFRFTKDTVLMILTKIEHLIKLPTNRGGCIQPINQLLLSLRFYATGSMYITMGDFLGVSKATTCRIIQRVSVAIASLRPQYVKMPTTEEEMQQSVYTFYRIARFPRVIGTIDCTHIRIQSPGGDDAEIYRNRKGFFSVNVQTVSDAQLKIRNIVARWPGSCHDQTIFNSSQIKTEFENGTYKNFLLLGDAGYSSKPYLMTPLQQTNTEAENLYNESLIRTRNTVERQYGVWKRRFPVLSIGMRLKIEKVLTVIVATSVLHNIAIDMKEPLPEGNDLVADEIPEEIFPMNEEQEITRQLLIQEYFTNL